MTLLENSYDFLNESLHARGRAVEEEKAWKFAVLDIVQSIELLLKARLFAEHPSLIYEDVDRRGKTVSLDGAVSRVTGAAQVRLTPKEQRAIRKAREWRDAIVHREFELPPYEVESVFAQLFEFASSFHNDHTEFGELHRQIDKELWDVEASLIETFKNGFVIYNGAEVPRWWPTRVMESQGEILMDLHGKQFQALPYGVEPGWEVNADLAPCHDCGVVKDMYHSQGCDVEACPRCFGQLISCGCAWDAGPSESEIQPLEVQVEKARTWAESMPGPKPVERLTEAEKERFRERMRRERRSGHG